MNSHFYNLSARSVACRSYVTLNGIRMLSAEASEKATGGGNVTMWIMPSGNQLEINIGMHPGDPRIGLDFHAEVVQLRGDEPMASAPRVASFRYPPMGMVDLEPLQEVLTFDGSPPARIWDRLSVIEPGDETRAAVYATAKRLYDSFSARDLDGMAAQLRAKGEDIGLCLGMAPEQGVASQRKFLGMLVEAQQKALPWVDEEFRLRFVCGRRLAQVQFGDRAVIQTAAGMGIDVYVGLLDGRWTVVR